jgi:hypothetical protein
MTKNMGTVDRLLRSLVAVILLMLIVDGTLSGAIAVVLGIIAVAFLLTSALGYCPAYPPLKLSTRKKAPG